MKRDQLLRRKFLKMGATGFGMFAAGGIFRQQQIFADTNEDAPFFSVKNIGDLLDPDENGVRLPPGYKSRVVARTGEAPTGLPGYTWHQAPDGGACFETEDGGWIYVSNSEVRSNGGGVGALRFDATGELIDAYPILKNTTINCAGGPTPWGTWLSCEEFDSGQVYECDPLGIKPAQVRPALGTFKHEAVTVDTRNQCLYLTEDLPDGGFYRFTPDNGLPDLTSGQLEIASVRVDGELSIVEWLPVPDPEAKHSPTRTQAPGYTPFRGGEGIALHEDLVFFTTKRDNRVWSYHIVNQQLEVVYDIETSDNPILAGVDNVVITPGGDVLIAEDPGNMQLIALTTDDEIIPLLQVVGHERSEIVGPAFDPSFQRLYFSSQRGAEGKSSKGITYEISYVG